MKTSGNFTFDWCLKFVETLATDGLRNVIISPGSRSTPLTLAFSAHPGICKTVVLDERSAAFIALGIAKITGNPAAIVCTSGTAAANYYPAVIEASMSEVPLLILTTDRPPNLRSIGASQAIDQLKIFGDYPRFFFEVGEPVDAVPDIKRLLLLANQAYRKSVADKGPVHINFSFRKPFEPEPDHYQSESERIAGSLKKRSADDTGEFLDKPTTSLPTQLTERIKNAKRPVIVAGGIDPAVRGDGPFRLAQKLNAPLLTEAHSQLSGYRSGDQPSFIYGFDSFLKNREIRQSLQPDLIIRFGSPTISKGLDLWLIAWESADQVVVNDSKEFRDPVITANDFYTVPSYRFNLDDTDTNTDTGWLNQWKQHSDKHADTVREVLDEAGPFTDGHAHYHISPKIPDDWLVMLSNSFPVRDFDLFGYRYTGEGPVLVNRGASGIDGVTSTFLGAAMASEKDAILITGDLAFLHDTNALLSARNLSGNQTIVILVLNNKGGGIFRMLPIVSYKDVFDTYFVTQQQADLEHLSRAYDIKFHRVESNGELVNEFKGLIGNKGFHIIECVTDSEQSMNLRLRLSR
ncbi:MAG TPA: 2-succinyl-5-enolpyruvyl-6-hydroxy-3-cyclohexene-1-carboxylic-acid synthase [Balneolales bacterium]|nr:2-succinyl-5-enolpyruvyl-6-hydroxy-3-cyclohexene-1-carboxylic-acid synthase [Balneolales bacterium]